MPSTTDSTATDSTATDSTATDSTATDSVPPDRDTDGVADDAPDSSATTGQESVTGSTSGSGTDTSGSGTGTRSKKKAGRSTKQKPTVSTTRRRGPVGPAPDHVPDSGAGAGTEEVASDRLWGVLRAHPGATPAELALVAKLSRPKVSALLTTWLAEGSVTAVAGATSRSARRWTAVRTTLTPAPAPAADAVRDARFDRSTTTVANDDAGVDGVDEAPRSTVSTDAPATGGRVSKVAGAAATQPPAATDDPAAADPDTGAGAGSRARLSGCNRSGSPRLSSGALRGMVEDHLRDHAGAQWSPVAIGKVLVRSSGAVANALEALVETDVAVRTSDKPKRYRLNTEHSDEAGDAEE